MRKVIFTAIISLAISAASQAQVHVGPFLGYDDKSGHRGLSDYS